MKKIISLLFPLLPLLLSAQQDTADLFHSEPGKTAGKIVAQAITRDGGSIRSSDGKITLTVPAGALSKSTQISILPVSNGSPNGNGLAYRLEPSGVHFEKPLQLLFNYDSASVKDSTQMLFGISMQDNKGNWYQLRKCTVDTVAKTVSGNINHFSEWSLFEHLSIKPTGTRVKINKHVQLIISVIDPPHEDVEVEPLDDGTLAPLRKPKYMSFENWSVNSVVKGNSAVGTITPTDMMEANYQAPATVPDKNPVQVSVSIKDLTYTFKGIHFKNLMLTSNITIYDNAYEVKVSLSIKSGSPESWGGVMTYRDEGSFVVAIQGTSGKLIAIKNSMESLTSNCSMIVLNPGVNTGSINITGENNVHVKPASPPGQPFAEVEITFARRPSVFTVFHYTCPPPRGYHLGASFTVPPRVSIPAYPLFVQFFAKEGEQVLQEMGKENDELYLKMTVKKLTD